MAAFEVHAPGGTCARYATGKKDYTGLRESNSIPLVLMPVPLRYSSFDNGVEHCLLKV